MSPIRWALSKSEELKRQRGVSFEEIVRARLVAIVEHPSRMHQSLLLFEHNSYIWVVPFVVQGDEVFLKTLFPSRKYTKKWKKGELP